MFLVLCAFLEFMDFNFPLKEGRKKRQERIRVGQLDVLFVFILAIPVAVSMFLGRK